MYANGFEYCPVQTIQILHNGAHHWLLLSSLDGTVTIYDSLNTRPTDLLHRQMTQLFSPDDALPAYKQHNCHKQVGGTDCGIFAIAYALDLLNGNEPHKIRYDQNKMREHLINCFEQGKMTTFPKYDTDADENPILTSSNDVKEVSWISPKRRYNLRSSQKSQQNTVPLSNRYSSLSTEEPKPQKQLTSDKTEVASTPSP